MGRKTDQNPVPMDTKWKLIPGYENYFVSNRSHIFNMKTKRLQALFINNKGLRCVRLYRNNKRRSLSVEKLRREAFGEKDEYNLPSM